MSPKRNRITKRDIAEILERGRSKHSPFFKFKYLPNKEGVYKISPVVSKKVAKQAVKRNRIRRRIYAALRDMAISPVKGLVFVVKDIQEVSHLDLVKELKSLVS